MSKRSAFCCRCIGVAAVVILIFYACDVSAQCIVETPLVQPPGDIALALDGTIWYVTAKIDNSLSPPKVVGLLGRVTPAGSVVEKTIGFSQPNAITLDPNGNVWFTDIQYNVIYRYVPSTDAFTSYSVMPASLPYDITLGPDGNLWFTTHSGFLGRITVNGTVTLFPLQEIGFQITAGPDGNLWFGSDEKLVQVTSTGQTARFPLPSGTRAYGLTPGPDGAIWFTDRNQPRIGRFALTGQTRFFTPTASGLLHSIAAGTDGNLWFTIETGDKIGKVTPSGSFTFFATPRSDSSPRRIRAGPNATVWFAESSAIGHLSVASVPPPSIQSVSPTFGPASGGTTVVITGQNFSERPIVRFADSQAQVVSATPTQVSAKTPARQPGVTDVSVTNCDGAAAVLNNAFSFDCEAPAISTQPQNQTITAGQSAQLHVAASGTNPLTYQWYRGQSPDASQAIANGTQPNLIVNVSSTSTFWVRVRNSCGTADSQTAVINVCLPPAISQQPMSGTLIAGSNATLVVTVSGSDPVSFQWYQGASGDATKPLPGATSSTLVTPPLFTDTSFWVRISNSCGAVQSATAAITVVKSTRRRSARH